MVLEEDGGRKRKRQVTSKAAKESKSVPVIVYEVEQFERYVIELSAKGHVNLRKYVKRSTARDFRIKDGTENEENCKGLKRSKKQ